FSSSATSTFCASSRKRPTRNSAAGNSIVVTPGRPLSTVMLPIVVAAAGTRSMIVSSLSSTGAGLDGGGGGGALAGCWGLGPGATISHSQYSTRKPVTTPRKPGRIQISWLRSKVALLLYGVVRLAYGHSVTRLHCFSLAQPPDQPQSRRVQPE